MEAEGQDLTRLKPALAAGSVCLFFFTFQFYRYFSLLIGIWILAGGIAGGYVLFSYFSSLPCLLINLKPKEKVVYEDDDKFLTPKGCTICGNPRCQRHRPEIARVKIQPWVGLESPESTDIALDEFLGLVLKNFVYGWYSDLSSDETFVDELRTSLRYIASVLVRRVRKIDITSLITEKLIKEGIKHFDIYTRAKEKVKQNEGSDNVSSVLKYLEPDMHCALYSRSAELQYLRKLADAVLPHLLPPQSLNCRGLTVLLRELLSGVVLLTLMDKLSDPDFVNSLWLVFLDKQPTTCHPLGNIIPFFLVTLESRDINMDDPQTKNHIPKGMTHGLKWMVASNQPPSSRVPFLENFARPRAPLRNSALHLSLGEILQSQTALFPFMQFMRKEAALNVLQFCLTIEDFNKRFFAPDLSLEEEQSLVKEAKEMYNSYFEVNAVDRINFEPSVVDGLKNSIEAPVNKMERLKMAALLSKAYEHAYNLLEGTFIPLFYQSDDYFSLLCGSRLPARPLCKPTSRALKKKFDPLAEFSKLAGKIKHKVLNPVREDLAPYYEEDPYDVTDVSPEFAVDSDEDEETTLFEEVMRDLSTWKITIPHVIMESKYKCIYIISIERPDAKEGEEKRWDAARRYKEFYVLQSKLEEFHGEIEDSSLPIKQNSSKLTSVKKPAAYYESCREQFENYLQVLAKNPLLKGSALLFNFLSPNKEFTNMFESSRKGNLAGKTIKSVTTMFTKEKGQNIDPFLQAFLNSIEEPSKQNQPRKQSVDAGVQVQTSDFNRKDCYPGRKTSSTSKPALRTDDKTRVAALELNGVTDYILFAAERLFKLPNWMLHMLSSFKIVGQQTLDSFAHNYLTTKVDLLKDEYRMVMIIHLLRDAIFFDQDPPRTDVDKLERREQTLKEMMEFLPDGLIRVIGTDRHEAAMNLLLELFQHPKVNKQLAYVLLDAVIEEIFPELNEQEKVDENSEVSYN